MATPLSGARLVQALRAEGVKVVEQPGWRINRRDHKGPWGPVHGVMIHHTVTSGTRSSVDLCFNGHSALPGPLCHGVIAKDGTVYMVGNGRTNHAGKGDRRVLDAVLREAPSDPPTRADTDGNTHFYGFEAINLGDGKDPWPAEQVEAIDRVSAALCRAHGWGERSVIGHAEWQPGKIDPKGVTGGMNGVRARVHARLDDRAQGDDVALSTDDIDRIAERVWRKDGILASPSTAAPGNTHWTADSYMRDVHARVRGLEETVLKAQTMIRAVHTELERLRGTCGQ